MSSPLPDDFRKALGLEGQPTVEEGLGFAEDRLKQVLEQLEKTPEKNPAHPRLKREQETLEPIVQELRNTLHGVKVDELCDAAEDALAEKPTRRAKARELLKQARREGKPLAADSVYLRRVQKLEGKLDEDPHAPASVSPEKTGNPPSSAGKDLDMEPTIPAPKGGHPNKGPASATGKPPGTGSTPLSKIHDLDDVGTGGAPSTIPLGLGAGFKVGGGRFTLIRELGRGGMGVVWLATDGLLKRDVAVKLLPPEVASDEMALSDLRRETVESQRLSHPHIIRIHDLYQAPGEPAFISMEYVDGTNLRSLLGKQPQRCLSWDFLRPLLAQLCSALDYAHDERVIHRDLKPSNLMLDSKGRLKLADFGIAASMSDSMSRVSQHTKDKDTSGTLNYMSPQQMRGDNPSASDDVYSLGATLYELLTSRTPFYRGDIQYQVKHEIPQQPAERIASFGITNEIPERVSTMIMSCLAKEPKERPQSGAWMMEQLEGTTRTGRKSPANISAPPTASLRSVPEEPAENLDAVVPPTVPPRPPGGGPSPAKDEPPPVKKPSVLPANVPIQPRPPVVPAAGSSGGKSKGVLVGVAAAVVLGLILFFAFHGKKRGEVVVDADKTPGVESNGTVVPAQVGGTSEIKVAVQPAGAEVLTNGQPAGQANGPWHFKGQPGQSIKLEARQDGYTGKTITATFPEAGKSESETINLQPMPTLLFVNSDPPATEVQLTKENGKPVTVAVDANGIPIEPGFAYDISITVPNRETIRTNIPAQPPGHSFRLDLQQVPEKTASLRVSADLPDTRFSIIYPGRPMVTYGTNSLITGIPPRSHFFVVAEHRGYASATNEVVLKPNEVMHTVHFDPLKEQFADLMVVATPRPFNLTIAWDGRTRPYGNSGRAKDLPAGRKLLITAEGESGSASTNVALEPGENTIYLGTLAAATGYLNIKSEPDGASVSYAVDDHPMIHMHEVSRLENLPLGHVITVILRKNGYADKTMVKRMDRSGDTLDFLRLVPLRTDSPLRDVPVREAAPKLRSSGGSASVKVYGPNEDAEIFVDGRPTGIKNDGVVSNLTPGRTYEIRLHRLGFEDVVQKVTMNEDGSEKYLLIDNKPVLTTNVSEPEIDAKLREIDAKMDDINKHIPFNDAYYRDINDWMDKNEKLYRRNSAIWPRIQGPLRQMKELVRARGSRQRR